MRRAILRSVLLIGALIPGMRAHAQQQSPQFQLTSTDVAVTYTVERAKIASGSCCFWLQGGSADVGFTLYRGLGLAVNLTGQHNSSIASGVGLDSVAVLAGPRYTFLTSRWAEHLHLRRENSVFGEALFGKAYAFNSVFPSRSGVTANSNSFAMQVGGGINVAIAKGLGLRPLEMDYVRTSFANDGSNSQNHLRIAFGATYRFGR